MYPALITHFPLAASRELRGGLSVMDFLKMVTVQEYTESALAKMGPAAVTLAEAEGLYGHAEAVRARGVQG